jgi:hypothetical protein
MGRPLHKKYFGNRNVGVAGNQSGVLANSQNYADDRIGGEGVASYGSIVAGSGWTTTPTVAFSAPNIPGGVSVAGTVLFKALSFATTANGTGYAVGDVVSPETGTRTQAALAPVAAIVTVGVPTVANGGTLYDVTGAVGDRVTFTNAGLSQALVVEITAVSGSTATTVEVVTPGIWNGAGAPATTTGWTAVTSGGPTDNNGSGLVLNLTWGAYSFGAVTQAGSFTTFPSTGTDGVLSTVTGGGSGAKADITMGLLGITVTQRGSGYTAPADAAVTFSGSTGAAATAVLTIDSGLVGSATNQENAIIIRANTDGEGAAIGDIIKQSSSRRYKVRTGDGTAVCKLVADNTPATFEAYIQATDDNGNTYFVTKLTAHKATLAQWSNNESEWLFTDGASAPWSFTSTADGRVIIENA